MITSTLLFMCISALALLVSSAWIPDTEWHWGDATQPFDNHESLTPEKETVFRFLHAYNDASVSEVSKVLAPDFHRYSSTTGAVQDKAYYLVMWKNFDASFPDEHWKFGNISQSGKNVTLQTTETGTFKYTWVMNNGAVIEPTGKNYTAPATTEFHLSDDCPPLIKSYHYSTVATGTGFLSLGLNGTALEAIVANGY